MKSRASSVPMAQQVSSMVAEINRDPAERKRLCRQSGVAFAVTYLRGEGGHAIAMPKCHVAWHRAVGNGDGFKRRDPVTGSYRQHKTLLLAPRDHGKTFVAAYEVVLHRIARNPDVRIIIGGPNLDSAVERLLRVRSELEENDLMQRDWAPDGFRDPKKSWTDTKLYVRRGDRSIAGPTLRAVGIGGKVTGGRADLAIWDDPEDEDSVRTEAVRKYTRRWWRATVQELLEPWGEILLIGTRKHNDDLYAHVLKDPTYRKPGSKPGVPGFRAIEVWPEEEDREWVKDDAGAVVDCIVRGSVQVLWPEKWTIGQLLVKRLSMTSRLFKRENQNEVVDDETARFKLAWLVRARERGEEVVDEAGVVKQPGMRVWRSSWEVPDGWVVIQAWDPAFVDDEEKAQEVDSDYFLGQTWAVNTTTWERRLIGIFRKRGLTPEQFTVEMRAFAAPFTSPTDVHPAGALKFVAVENNSFGRFYELGLRRDTDLPLVKHSTTSKKADIYEGVDAMAQVYENDKASFAMVGASAEHREHVGAMIDELHGLGTERHDDTVLCQWIAECVIRRYKEHVERQRKQGGNRRDPERPSVERTLDDGATEDDILRVSRPLGASVDAAALAVKAVRDGDAVVCTEEEYKATVREALQAFAGRSIDEGAEPVAVVALEEVRRLDAVFERRKVDRGERPPESVVEVVLHSMEPAAITATARTIEQLPGRPRLVQREGRFFMVGGDGKFLRRAVVDQGYVKDTIGGHDGDGKPPEPRRPKAERPSVGRSRRR